MNTRMEWGPFVYQVCIIGSGGHARTIQLELCPLAGLLRKDEPEPDPVRTTFLIGIGDNRLRRKIANQHPRHYWTNIGNEVQGSKAGALLFPGGHLSVACSIGAHVIINHGAVVNHDAVIGDFAHIAPGAQVLGAARVGTGAFIGANAVVLPGAEVPDWAVIRACSVWPADYTLPDGTARKGRNSRNLMLKYQQEK